jgi:hypothetical protein
MIAVGGIGVAVGCSIPTSKTPQASRKTVRSSKNASFVE